MVKGIDIITKDSVLQSHLAKRAIAFIIDCIICGITSIIILWFVFVDILGVLFSIGIFVLGIILILYSTLMENLRGATFGKQLMHLKVVSVSTDKIQKSKIFIRNISKIHLIILLVDTAIGLIIDGDPRQRYLDRIAKTTVVRTDITETFAPVSMPKVQEPSKAEPIPISKPSAVTTAPSKDIITAFSKIPGITYEKATSLYNSGYNSFADLKNAQPEKLLCIPGITLQDLKNINDAIEILKQ